MKWITVIALVLNVTYTVAATRLIGGCNDEHGCNGCAGYSWCNSTQACHRVWEENILC